MAMNEWLAQVYNTNGAAEQQTEETQKLASAELFAKVASKHGLDLSQMSAEEKGQLYATVFPEEAAKLAAVDGTAPEAAPAAAPAAADDGETKMAAAAEHWQEKRASQEKYAEADLMGRVMAHSFTDELGKIKTAMHGEDHDDDDDKDKDKDKGDKKMPPPFTKKDGGDKEEEKDGSAMPKNANAAAFEELAARRAIEMAKQAEYDGDKAFQLINAVFTLGLSESEKVASVQNFEDGLHIRALEYLEAAKFPVNWEEVYGK